MPLGASRAGLMSVAEDDIPDSAIAHYRLAESSGDTLTDEIGDNDGTASGASIVSNNYVGGYARDGDGTDDVLEFATFNDFDYVQSWQDGTASLLTFETTDESRAIYANNVDDDSPRMEVNTAGEYDSPSGRLEWAIVGEDFDNRQVVYSDIDVTDGTRYRLQLNKTGNSASDMEIYLVESDGTVHDGTNVAQDATLGSFNDLSEPMRCLSNGFVFQDAVVDNVIPCNGPITASERNVDIDNQPWI